MPDLPTGQAHLDLGLAALCSLGGLLGWTRKRSKASLIAGSAFGAAYGASAYLIQSVDGYQGHIVGAATSALLATGMGARLVRTRKLMPAGLLTGLGLAAFAYHVKKAQEWA